MTIIPQYTKSFKVYFNTCDETTCGSAYHMEYLDMDLECDTCGFMGSYYLAGEKYKIGQCSICLMKSGVVDKIIIDWMVYITSFANKDMEKTTLRMEEYNRLAKYSKTALIEIYGSQYRINSVNITTPKGDIITEILDNTHPRR